MPASISPTSPHPVISLLFLLTVVIFKKWKLKANYHQLVRQGKKNIMQTLIA